MADSVGGTGPRPGVGNFQTRSARSRREDGEGRDLDAPVAMADRDADSIN